MPGLRRRACRLSPDARGDRQGRSALHGAGEPASAYRSLAAAGCACVEYHSDRKPPLGAARLRAGSAVSALAATGLVAIVLRNDDQQLIEAEIVSAHLRSLQPGHLIDVVSSDQHTVKPWFNGKLDVSPPVIDLTAQGFTLIGGRLDYVDNRAIGAVVYKRRAHVINLFVAQTSNMERKPAKIETVQGFNIRRWSDRGLNYWAVSDIGADELAEFGEKFEAASKVNKEG
jgi:anti-sigma factor RsiW